MDKKRLVREHYANVLMKLCEKRSLTGITVSDIVQEADTARQTFYNYFSDLNDLICFTAFLPMAQSSDPFTDPESTRKAYELTLQHKSFFRQLPHHSGQNNFWEALDAWLKKTYYERYVVEGLSDEERAYRKMCIDLYCSGSAAAFKDWCARGLDTPVDAIVAMLYDMSPSFVKADLKRMPSRMTEHPR